MVYPEIKKALINEKNIHFNFYQLKHRNKCFNKILSIYQFFNWGNSIKIKLPIVFYKIFKAENFF